MDQNKKKEYFKLGYLVFIPKFLTDEFYFHLQMLPRQKSLFVEGMFDTARFVSNSSFQRFDIFDVQSKIQKLHKKLIFFKEIVETKLGKFIYAMFSYENNVDQQNNKNYRDYMFLENSFYHIFRKNCQSFKKFKKFWRNTIVRSSFYD
jgi:hypothetical protein